MLELVWPTLPASLRTELITQCVKRLRSVPEESQALALIIADITKSRPQTVRSQWKMANIYGTSLAIARDPQKASPFLAQTFMTSRKADVAALYDALGVEHADLEVLESSAVTSPPTEARFAGVLKDGIAGLEPDVVRCAVALIADAGIDSWQDPARRALHAHLAEPPSAHPASS